LLPGNDVAAARGAEIDLRFPARSDEERVADGHPVGGQVASIDLGRIAVPIHDEKRPVVLVERGVHVRDADVGGNRGLPAENPGGAQVADQRPPVLIEQQVAVEDRVVRCLHEELKTRWIADPARPELVAVGSGGEREEGGGP
jgi:hypothetical protein